MSRKYETGANGFIGKNLLAKLKGVTTIPHDQILKTELKTFSYFYFLSTYGNMATHTDDKKIIQANVIDLAHIVNQLVGMDIKSFVFMSSSSVKLPRQTMYSRTKKAAEEILLAHIEKHNLPICIVRPFSVTGVGEQAGHLIPTLIRSCLDQEHMSFVPNPSHDFIDVDDVTNGLINLATNGARGIYELGWGQKHSNDDVRKIVEDVTGKKANYTEVPHLRDYDTKHWVSTNFRSRHFGWKPEKTLRESIEEMVEAYAK